MKVYKIDEKKNPGVVIYLVKTKNIFDYIDKFLGKITEHKSDICFIFPEEICKDVDPEKFSSIYRAVWYGVYSGDEILGYWEALDYLESLGGYTSLSIITSVVSEKSLESLQRFQYSGIEPSVFKTRPLTNKEKQKIYVREPKIIELLFGLRFKWWGTKKNTKGRYLKETSEDYIFFLRPRSIRITREKLTGEILDSFCGLSIGSFLASIIPEETRSNMRIDETKI